MGWIVANWRLPITVTAVLLITGCAATKTEPPTSIGAATPSPSVTATSTATPTPAPTPTPTLTPTPTQTPVPALAPWREVPQQPSVSAVQFLDVTWTGTRFVATGSALDGRGVFVDSTDGVTWHRQKGGVADGGPGALAAGPGGVVAVGQIGGTQASWSSVDGLTWATHPKAFPMPAVGSDTIFVTDVVARGDGWLAVGRRDPACQIDCMEDPSKAYAWTSSDGSHWTRVADQAAFKGGGMDAVAGGDEGFVAVGVASGRAAIWTSPDGLAWSRVPDATMFHGPKLPGGSLPVHASGVAVRDGVTVVVGSVLGQDSSGLRFWWSPDGRTWSKGTVKKADEGQMTGVTATPDGFLAVGGSIGCLGGIWSSTDGRAWRCEASNKKFQGFGPYAAAASDTVEVAVGLTDAGWDENSGDGMPGAAWYRTLR
jgi:hypothetical protein